MALNTDERPGDQQLTRFLAVLDILQEAPFAASLTENHKKVRNTWTRLCLPLIVGAEYYNAERVELEKRLGAGDTKCIPYNLIWTIGRQKGKISKMGAFIAALSLMSQRDGEIIAIRSCDIHGASELGRSAIAFVDWMQTNAWAQEKLRGLNIQHITKTDKKSNAYCITSQNTGKIHYVTTNAVNNSKSAAAPHVCIINNAKNYTCDAWDTEILPLLESPDCIVMCINGNMHMIPSSVWDYTEIC